VAAIASRYARALVDVVLADKLDATAVTEQLQAFVNAVHDSDDLRRVWESPAVLPDQKRAVLDAIAREIGALKPVRNFMAVLIDHRRIPMLAQMLRQFQVELDAQLGFAEAEITSVHPLLAEEKRGVESQVEQLTGKKVRARYQASPELLGGIVVKVGSTIYDGSVRGQLQKLREQLSAE
jgi:F-type H+-transporting ATPase subunit delta